MSIQSEKDRRKEILRQLKAEQKENFNNSLPIGREIFQDLLEHLNDTLGDGCDHSLRMTRDFLKERGVGNIDTVVEWLNDNGGCCDCEVLMNMEENFE